VVVPPWRVLCGPLVRVGGVRALLWGEGHVGRHRENGQRLVARQAEPGGVAIAGEGGCGEGGVLAEAASEVLPPGRRGGAGLDVQLGAGGAQGLQEGGGAGGGQGGALVRQKGGLQGQVVRSKRSELGHALHPLQLVPGGALEQDLRGRQTGQKGRRRGQENVVLKVKTSSQRHKKENLWLSWTES
jgi:hypothetical protein